jgi:hypothetical protein
MTVLAFLPIPVVAFATLLLPRRHHVEKFGAGRWRTKVQLLVFTAAIATLGAGFRVGTGFVPRPAGDPAWYHGRACYYCFNFLTDLVISAVFIFARFDRRFIVPDGAKGPGDYGKSVRMRLGGESPTPPDSSSCEEGHGETDAEKFPGFEGTGACEDSDDSVPPPIYEAKGKGKEIDVSYFDVTIPDDEMTDMLGHTLAFNRRSETFGPFGPSGEWTGLHPKPPSLRVKFCYEEDNPGVESPFYRCSPYYPSVLKCGFVPIDRMSSQRSTDYYGGDSSSSTHHYGGDSSSSTCIQEPEPAHMHHYHHTYQQRLHSDQLLENGQRHVYGQAYTTSDDESPLTETSVSWPFNFESIDDDSRSLPDDMSISDQAHVSERDPYNNDAGGSSSKPTVSLASAGHQVGALTSRVGVIRSLRR